MKLTTLPILIASALLAQVASAQSSSTPIIGYYKFDVPQGTTILSAGFVKKKDFQGAMTSVTPGAASMINQTGATFPTFTNSYVEILSGPNAGTILDILSNTGTQIEVDAELGPTGLNLVGTETYCVRAHNTLGSVFQAGGGFIAGGVDTVTLYGEVGSETYSHNGTNWEDGGANDADGVIIYPGQAFVVDHQDPTPVTITVGGGAVSYVKYGPTNVSLYPGVPNLVGLVNPLVALNSSDPAYATSRNQLGNYGFVASLVAGNDTVDHYSLDGLFVSPGSYTSNGTFMEDGGANDVSTELVTNGAGLVVGVSVEGVYSAPQLHPNP